MTVLMTITGVFVFLFSTFKHPFQVAFKRLWMFALTGVLIDMLLISVAVTSSYLYINY